MIFFRSGYIRSTTLDDEQRLTINVRSEKILRTSSRGREGYTIVIPSAEASELSPVVDTLEPRDTKERRELNSLESWRDIG